MKKKIIITIIAILVIVIGVTSFIIWDNRVVSTITLDINPSIEIKLGKNEIVKKIVALNDDAKEIINDNLNGKDLKEVVEVITEKVIEEGYIEDNYVVILLHTKGSIKNEDINNRIRNSFEEKNVNADIIVIDKMTKEDEEIAKKYNITPSKAAYINSILKENENIGIENLVNQSVNDLDETKNSGNYCEDGYFLEGNMCLKEIKRVAAKSGQVCPVEYYEYKGKCYEETPIEHTDKLICRDELKLKDGKCVRTFEREAEPSKYSCPQGEETTRLKAGLSSANDGDANEVICIDLSNAKHPVSPCETHDGTEYTVSGGKCYWHRAPVIASGCPGKIQIGGTCWDDASNVLICEGYRDGKRYSSRSEYCEHSIKYIKPNVTEYKCPSDYTLSDSKCLKYEIEDAEYEQVCKSGYTLVDNDRCINLNKVKNKENGYVCDSTDERVKGNECVTYDVVFAKHN